MSEENTPNTENENNEIPNIPELDKYIFSQDEYTAGIVPRKLEAEKVARWLIGKIKKEHDANVFERAELTADFYDTFEVAPTFKAFLDRGETDEASIGKSASIARTIAHCGGAENIDFAKQYYKHLIGKSSTFRSFEELVRLHEAIGLGGNSAELRQRIRTVAAPLESQAKTDYRARLELKNLQWPIEQKLRRAEKVEEVKSKILSIGDRKKRVQEETKAYLGIGYGYVEYLYPWAARRLRRETWAPVPAEQEKRNDEAPLKSEVAGLLRSYASDPSLSPNGNPGGKASLKLRLLRAIKFFGGEIKADEEDLLLDKKSQQSDILANEGFLIKAE